VFAGRSQGICQGIFQVDFFVGAASAEKNPVDCPFLTQSAGATMDTL